MSFPESPPLAYAFLLSLVAPCYDLLRLWLLRFYCQRTGWHLREVKAPLYRLSSALSRLWLQHPPNFALLARRPGAPTSICLA